MEDETRPGSLFLIVVFDRIRKTAGVADDGEGSVGKGVQLIKTAGFVNTGNEKEIATGFDEVGESFIVTDTNAEVGKIDEMR